MDMIDRDTRELGTEPPFECWEGGQSALTMVLQDAHREGLNLDKDTAIIAGIIMRSRWFAAATRSAHRTPAGSVVAGNSLPELFRPGMRVDRVNGDERGGEVMAVDVTRDTLHIVQVQWPTDGGGYVEWCDPEDLVHALDHAALIDRSRIPTGASGPRLRLVAER
ncbi:hypothetical protein [Leifsonia shinshuensis]|uniref:hypothetical protein n=1 Tax=Leifsonia shinshuensis TaxID=150026 RepID=UPI002866B777|nr:hypothetical protein [Leifsonia shinshuensis]MDR6972199.1 hypothetical protein [Leifsonia shinshuensis]